MASTTRMFHRGIIELSTLKARVARKYGTGELSREEFEDLDRQIERLKGDLEEYNIESKEGDDDNE